jgi:hypothetical protein
MSFGKLAASAFSGTIENTVALATLNFDFSLVKVEAPAEYKEFGMQLSAQRSEEAENGLLHVTARKLGALFADVVPACPKLVAAYGLRVSEIAQSTSHNPRGSWSDGAFAEQLGADGTSIWAAATSGYSAIAVHLLACMLARVWTPPKAISIWVELILKRKNALLLPAYESAIGPTSLATAQISVNREQIAKWDSSARAWLQTADAFKALPQTQLMLIVNNISTPVNEKAELYESVILAWQTAMTVMEGIISGVSQSFHTGASLLGLCAWHLYPNILVLGEFNKTVNQDDPLIPPGTIATLGLQDREVRCTEHSGIFWSLPLAYLRFYGDPVQAVGSVEEESGLDIDQLMQVALGSFLGQWVQSYAEFPSAANTLVVMSDFLLSEKANWLKGLAEAARAYLNSTGLRHDQYSRLLKSGRRRYPYFLSEKEHWISPFLGLTNPNRLINLSMTVEDRIGILRSAAVKYGETGHMMIIRYFTERFHTDGHFEYATVLPVEIPGRRTKRTWCGDQNSAKAHIRWVPGTEGDHESHCEAIRDLGENPVELPTSSIWEPAFGTGLKWRHAPLPFSRERSGLQAYGNIITEFDLILGDRTTAALYIVQGEILQDTKYFTASDIQQAFQKSNICTHKFVDYLNKLDFTEDTTKNFQSYSNYSRTVRSVKALYVAADAYKHLQGARIAIKVAERPLYRAKWVMEYQAHILEAAEGLPENELTFAQVFACIASLESGSIDIDPGSLNYVMAMSIGNSIYIAAPLICDPAECFNDVKVKRVVGNVGRPGMAMLITPRDPRMSKLDHDTWNHVNHDGFDGKVEDCFQHTTLHLSFTDWEMPIDVGAQGARDREVFFLEAPVSIHHKGKWVADIDVLSMVSSQYFSVNHRSACEGHESRPVADVRREIDALQLVAIDSWVELIDTPLEPAVVRAHQNWQARLAATALSIQRGHMTFVMPNSPCWQCCLGTLGSLSTSYKHYFDSCPTYSLKLDSTDIQDNTHQCTENCTIHSEKRYQNNEEDKKLKLISSPRQIYIL